MDPNVLEIQRACNALGSRLKEDGALGPRTRDEVMGYLREVMREREVATAKTIPVPAEDIDITIDEDLPPTQKDGSGLHRVALTLGQLALAWCLEEAERWGAQQVSDERIKEYLRGCTRENAPGHGKWLHDTFDPRDPDRCWAHCAAAQGFAEDRGGGAQFRNSMPPWRSGALELMRDAQAGRRPNERWAERAEFFDESGHRLAKAPPAGSLVIYGNRTSQTKGHVERLIEALPAGIRSVGANENARRWVIDAKPVPWLSLERSDGTQRLYLLGFIVPLEVQP